MMAKAIKFDKYMAALTARGYKVVNRGKYVKMQKPAENGGTYTVYVGTRGAVRSGKNLAKSRPLSDAAKAKLLAEGAALL